MPTHTKLLIGIIIMVLLKFSEAHEDKMEPHLGIKKPVIADLRRLFLKYTNDNDDDSLNVEQFSSFVTNFVDADKSTTNRREKLQCLSGYVQNLTAQLRSNFNATSYHLDEFKFAMLSASILSSHDRCFSEKREQTLLSDDNKLDNSSIPFYEKIMENVVNLKKEGFSNLNTFSFRRLLCN